MSTAAVIAAYSSLAVAGVGAVNANVNANRAEATQKEQGRVSAAAQKIEDASRLRKQAREARIQKARILQASEESGGGSRESGAISSLGTQLGANQGRMAGQQNTANTMTGLNQDLANSNKNIALSNSIKGLGMQAFNTAGGFDTLFGE